MSLIKNLDCKDTAPAYNFNPVYYACFGWKSLPSQFQATVYPTTQTQPIPPGVDCATLGWTTTTSNVVLTRQACSYTWAWSNGTGAYLLLSNSTTQPLMCGTANMPDITQQMSSGTYWYVLDGIDLAGSCSWNQETNETTFIMTGKVLNSSGCEMPFEIRYTGV